MGATAPARAPGTDRRAPIFQGVFVHFYVFRFRALGLFAALLVQLGWVQVAVAWSGDAARQAFVCSVAADRLHLADKNRRDFEDGCKERLGGRILVVKPYRGPRPPPPGVSLATTLPSFADHIKACGITATQVGLEGTDRDDLVNGCMKRLQRKDEQARVAPGYFHTPNQGVIAVTHGPPRRVYAFFSVDNKCQSTGTTSIRVDTPPTNGKFEIVQGMSYPLYPTKDPRSACNKRLVRSVQVWYKPDDTYVGRDGATLTALFPGNLTKTIDLVFEIY